MTQCTPRIDSCFYSQFVFSQFAKDRWNKSVVEKRVATTKFNVDAIATIFDGQLKILE